MSRMLIGPLLEWARTLRYPALFKLTAALLAINLLVPDPLPFVDELVLGLVTAILASRKNHRQPPAEPRPSEKA